MEIIIYSKDGCGFCDMSMKYLQNKNMEYTKKNISENIEYKNELLKLNPNAKMLPQIFVNDKHIGGYNELKNYFK